MHTVQIITFYSPECGIDISAYVALANLRYINDLNNNNNNNRQTSKNRYNQKGKELLN